MQNVLFMFGKQELGALSLRNRFIVSGLYCSVIKKFFWICLPENVGITHSRKWSRNPLCS